VIEHLHIDPEDLVEETIQDYSSSGGRELARYFMFVAFFAFFGFISYASKFTNPSELNSTADEHPSLFGMGVGFVVVVVLPCALWIWYDLIRKYESGSRINLLQRKIFWWDGPPPRVEQAIEIDGLDKITFEATGEDTEDIVLWMKSGSKVVMPDRCVKDSRDWAKAIISRFPHIANGEPSPFFKF
jgi:hypothetical protein